MHFHGVHYKPSSDGAYVPGFSGRDGNVKPGQNWTYRLNAVHDSVGVWPYHDHGAVDGRLDHGRDVRDALDPRPHERAPDREFVVVFAPMGHFQTIDGRAFVGNTPVFTPAVGDRVQWDVMAMGSEHHTFHVHGHRWREPDGTPTDTKTVGPAETFRVRWREERPGHLALPLPRRVPHGGGHDRHLPGGSAGRTSKGPVLRDPRSANKPPLKAK